MSTAREQASKSLFWSGLDTFSQTGFSIVALMALARLLSVQEMGLGALAILTAQLLAMPLEFLFHDSLIQRKDLRREHLSTALSVTLIGSAAIAATLIVFAPWIARQYGKPELSALLRFTAFAIPITGVSTVLSAILRRNLAFALLARRTVIGRLSGTVLGVIAAMMGFGAWSLAFMYVGSMAFSTSVLWLSRDVRPSWGCQWQVLCELLHFGAPNMVSQMMLIANARLFVLIAGLYLDEFALGKLSLAFRVVEECRNTLSSAASLVALPLLTRRATFPAEFTKVFSEATSFTACILMPIYTGLAVTAGDWLTVAFGNKWQNAATTVQILAITALLLTLRQYANIALDAIGRPAMNMLINGLAFTFSVVLLIGASSTHPEAVAGVWALRAVLLSAASLLGVARAVNVTCRAQLQSVMPPFLAALMMGLCVMFLNGTVLVAQLPGIRLTIGIVSGVLIYISMLTIFSPQLFRRFLKFLFATIKT